MLRYSLGMIVVACVCMLGTSCPVVSPDIVPDHEDSTSPLFEDVWLTFDEEYSYFEHKEIDWEDVWDRYHANFFESQTPDEFVDELLPMLGELHDWHVEIKRADGTWVGTNPYTYVENYPHTPRNRYLDEGESYEVMGDAVIYHAWLEDNIAYIRVNTFSTEAFDDISDEAIEDLFATYAAADGMIFDIRPNNGGNENMAMLFTSRFTDEDVVYGYTETRNGPDHGDFDPLVEKVLEPSEGVLFDGPVACLIGQKCLSSAEWCTLMMRACPNVILIGDYTRGGSGGPETFDFSNGVSIKLSRWIAYTSDMEAFEDVGISPDIEVITGEGHGFDSEHDYVLEEAMNWLTAP